MSLLIYWVIRLVIRAPSPALITSEFSLPKNMRGTLFLKVIITGVV